MLTIYCNNTLLHFPVPVPVPVPVLPPTLGLFPCSRSRSRFLSFWFSFTFPFLFPFGFPFGFPFLFFHPYSLFAFPFPFSFPFSFSFSFSFSFLFPFPSPSARCVAVAVLGVFCPSRANDAGTGNDLARVLGWGGSFSTTDTEALAEVLDRVEKSTAKLFDRWSIHSITDNDEPATGGVVAKESRSEAGAAAAGEAKGRSGSGATADGGDSGGHGGGGGGGAAAREGHQRFSVRPSFKSVTTGGTDAGASVDECASSPELLRFKTISRTNPLAEPLVAACGPLDEDAATDSVVFVDAADADGSADADGGYAKVNGVGGRADGGRRSVALVVGGADADTVAAIKKAFGAGKRRGRMLGMIIRELEAMFCGEAAASAGAGDELSDEDLTGSIEDFIGACKELDDVISASRSASVSEPDDEGLIDALDKLEEAGSSFRALL
jgi:hypothetical protein